jgi:hypothetical protein
MKVKLFWQSNPVVHLLFSGKSDKNARALEDQINAWLSENPRIKIADIRQSAYYTSLGTSLWLISVWYEEGTA